MRTYIAVIISAPLLVAFAVVGLPAVKPAPVSATHGAYFALADVTAPEQFGVWIPVRTTCYDDDHCLIPAGFFAAPAYGDYIVEAGYTSKQGGEWKLIAGGTSHPYLKTALDSQPVKTLSGVVRLTQGECLQVSVWHIEPTVLDFGSGGDIESAYLKVTKLK